ncbi:phosphatase PAP2 family protein [Abyssalbus ytuae]|uniref:Phosphatase PAP2 family protein n=1 Tax=Abyssalbus ytuae TaxID=2926907 RepID=A0A9E6ZNU6_9FLAO|nr:phosphatase PAP2 family protein [Abyssalbus ytuae]UOB19379.1 phosphatase PAP2 family protein [Abyssalbus ytuae]
MKIINTFLSGILFLTTFLINAQSDSIYFEQPQKKYRFFNDSFLIDASVTAVAAGVTLYNFSKIYNKPRSSEESVLALDPQDVNRFDRSAAGNYDEDLKDISDGIFYGVIPYPLIGLLLNKETRQDFWQLSFLYLETMSLTGVTYSTSQQLNDRRRPYVYNEELSMGKRTRGSGRNSFFGGHPALVATATFFFAKVYDDYHPDSNFKWVLYGVAGAATYATAHLRVLAGQHFPSDVIVGSIIGTASGILIPHFHKNKLFKKHNVSLLPVTGEYHGLYLAWSF